MALKALANTSTIVLNGVKVNKYMSLFYFKAFIVECVVFLFSFVLFRNDNVVSGTWGFFSLANIFGGLPALLLIKVFYSDLHYYYSHKVYQYKKYFKNKKIKHIFRYICANKYPRQRPYYTKQHKVALSAHETKWNDYIRQTYAEYDLSPAGTSEEFLLHKVSYYKDNVLLDTDKNAYRNVDFTFVESAGYIIDHRYANIIINQPAGIHITPQQYDYFKMLLNAMPADIVYSLFDHESGKYRIFGLWLFLTILLICLVLFLPYIEFIAGVLIVAAWIAIMVK